jgi:hypothetical protein
LVFSLYNPEDDIEDVLAMKGSTLTVFLFIESSFLNLHPTVLRFKPSTILQKAAVGCGIIWHKQKTTFTLVSQYSVIG